MRQLRLMIELKAENLVIGSVDLFEYDPHNNRAGIGILIDDAYQRKIMQPKPCNWWKNMLLTFWTYINCLHSSGE